MHACRLLQFTDTHLHTDPARRVQGVDPGASLRRVLAEARRLQPPADALLLSGDLVHDDPAAYPLLREAFAGFGAPVYCLAGNHDEAHRLAGELAGASFQVHGTARLGAWRLVLLDSTVPGEPGGRLGRERLAALARTLAREESPTLICLHHPPLPLGSRWLDRIGLSDGDALHALLRRHPQVRAVVFGHAHQEADIERDGIRYLCTPSTCSQFLPGSDAFAVEDRPPGFRILDLAANGDFRTAVVRAGRVQTAE